MWAPAEDGGTEMAGNFELDMWDDGYPGLIQQKPDLDLLLFREVIGRLAVAGQTKKWICGSMKFYTLDEEYQTGSLL